MAPDSGAKKLMGYPYLVVFANDDTISEGELHMIEKIALEGNVIDEDEKRILKKNILPRYQGSIDRLYLERDIEIP